ncbi:immunity 49 family protein [Streptomyces sp. NPDC006251]|uniref:immunity 49 family protein n=1 Tax=Streptomyces sp. NPDC006251 TaxID=3155718 RepID=UPI0033A1000D
MVTGVARSRGVSSGKGVGTIDFPKLPENAVTLPEGTVKLPDGTVQLPEGAALPDGATKLPDGNVRLPDDAPVLPEGTTKLPTEDGAPARYYDPDGNILDEHGNVLQKSADGPGDVVDQPHLPDTPAGPASGADTPRVDSPAQQPALVGAGTHTAEQAGQHIRLGNSLDDGFGGVGRAGDDGAAQPAHAGSTQSHAGAWLTSWYLATICRENDRLDRLARVPISLLRDSGATFDEYVYDWVAALQNYWFRRASETWGSLVAAINGTDPEQVRVADRETMLKQLYPPLELFQLYNRRESEQFNSSLVEFLNWHKQYWSNTEERSHSANGLVSLGLLAIVCMAYDNDMPIDVETEYLPKHLVKRSWVGEYDT